MQRSPALIVLLLFMPCAFCEEAPTVLGHVRSNGTSLKLNGADVPFAGTREWPLVDADEVLTDTAAAVLLFLDGSRVTLAARSHLRIESVDDRTKVRLLDGSLQFKLSDRARVDIYNRGLRQNGSAGNASTAPPGRTSPPASSSGRLRPELLPPLSRSR